MVDVIIIKSLNLFSMPSKLTFIIPVTLIKVILIKICIIIKELLLTYIYNENNIIIEKNIKFIMCMLQCIYCMLVYRTRLLYYLNNRRIITVKTYESRLKCFICSSNTYF